MTLRNLLHILTSRQRHLRLPQHNPALRPSTAAEPSPSRSGFRSSPPAYAGPRRRDESAPAALLPRCPATGASAATRVHRRALARARCCPPLPGLWVCGRRSVDGSRGRAGEGRSRTEHKRATDGSSQEMEPHQTWAAMVSEGEPQAAGWAWQRPGAAHG